MEKIEAVRKIREEINSCSPDTSYIAYLSAAYNVPISEIEEIIRDRHKNLSERISHYLEHDRFWERE